jgi:hypothetical protein
LPSCTLTRTLPICTLHQISLSGANQVRVSDGRDTWKQEEGVSCMKISCSGNLNEGLLSRSRDTS